MLWKKEKDGSAYTNVLKINHESIKHLAEAFPMAKQKDGSRVKQKSNPRAKKYRFDGNMKVQTEEWHEAMYLYNKCLCNCEPHSENISLAYANRSLCFLKLKMYKKCLTDIDLAIEALYPDRLMPKLMSRRAYCLNKIKEEEQVEDNEPKLDFPEDKLFPGMANVLKIECNPEFGRHVVATCNIEVGKVVLAEEAYVTTAVMATEKMLCSYCFKENMNFIACNHCNISMFCNEDCYQRLNLYGLHEMSCGKQIDKIDHLVTFAARSVLIALNTFRTMDALMKFVESVTKFEEKDAPSSLADDVSKYRAFLQCGVYMSKEEKKKLVDTANQMYTHLTALEDVKSKIGPEDGVHERFFQHLLLQHLYIIKSNSFQNKVKGGLFLIQRHFNHSCAPNLLQYFTANKTVCFTSRSIKKGDQLFITYGTEDFWLEPTFVRLEVLQANFGFKCNCEKCFGFGKKEMSTTDINWLTGETSGELKIERDYQYLRGAMKDIDYSDTAKCNDLKKKCLGLLKKYHAMPWAHELDTLCNSYVKLLNETN